MGRSAAAEISRNLTAAGLSGATPVLLACDVSLASERLLQTRLDLLHIAVSAFSSDQPTLILVGEALAVGGRMQMVGSGLSSLRDGLPQSTSPVRKLDAPSTVFASKPL
jgi:uroporphyrin-III C-methyltransferase